MADDIDVVSVVVANSLHCEVVQGLLDGGNFSGRYWRDWGFSPSAPINWRCKGGPGAGALADVGSHLAYVSELLCGDIKSTSGGRLSRGPRRQGGPVRGPGKQLPQALPRRRPHQPRRGRMG
jgi:predicted dehydrogenase